MITRQYDSTSQMITYSAPKESSLDETALKDTVKLMQTELILSKSYLINIQIENLSSVNETLLIDALKLIISWS